MAAEVIGNGNPDGSTLGSGITEKVSLYGITPVAQRANASQAVATDAATTMVLANELRAALVALGAIKGAA
jgi:hypothetical protein